MKKLLGAFGSDNFSGVAPEIMQALIEANEGSAKAYGGDGLTQKAEHTFQKHFGPECKVFFAFNGTGANVASLSSALARADSIIAAGTAHIVTQETAAAYSVLGCKIITIPSISGKIQPSDIEKGFLQETFWARHASRPKVVSISQATECGTIYTVDEIREISRMCKKYDMLLHVDGCRLANAAEALSVELSSFNSSIGIDLMTFGGTKNGMMFGEAILFFKKELCELFPYLQKQTLQLASKMRFISAQFIPYLESRLWQKYAGHSNEMAAKIEEGIKGCKKARLIHPRQTNQLFISMPTDWIIQLQKEFELLLWDRSGVARLITSFNTQEDEVSAFLLKLKEIEEKDHG